MKGDQNIWTFYESGAVMGESPSRVQYFWASETIRDWLISEKNIKNVDELKKAVIEAHQVPAKDFKCFIFG